MLGAPGQASKRETMRIICPQCGFFRELPDHKVPVTSTMATCPKCRHRFKFRLDREQAASRSESRSRVTLPVPEDGESSWRRPGPAATRREAEATARFEPEPLSEPPSEDDSQEIPAARNRRAPQAPSLAEEPDDFPPSQAARGRRASQPVSAPEEPDTFSAPVPGNRRAPRSEPLADEPDDEPSPQAVRTRQHLDRLADEEVSAPSRQPADPVPPVRETGRARPRPDFEDDAPTQPAAPMAPREPVPAADDDEPRPVRRAAQAPVPETPARPEADEAPETPAPPRATAGRHRADGVRDIWARLKAMDDEDARKRPAADPSEADEEPTPREVVTDPIPWERLDGYGFLPGLGLTLKKILLSPLAFFSQMPEGRPKGKALVFNLIISEFLLVLDFLWSLMGLRAKLGGPAAQPDTMGAVATSPSLGFLIALLLVPLAIACGIYLDAWFTHLLLLLFRSAKKGFNETFRVMCYSAAPTVLTAIPVAGQLLSPVILVWYMALQAIGLKKVHEAAYTQTLAAIFIKWSVYLFLLLAMLQNLSPGH